MTASSVSAQLRLRPVTPADERWLFELALNPSCIAEWRLRGQTPSFAEFQRILWTGVVCQFAVELRGTPVGLVTAYDSHPDGFMFGAVMVDPELQASPVALTGYWLLLEHVFRHFPVRMVYAEIGAETMFRMAGERSLGLFEVEGRFKDRRFTRGMFCDEVVLVTTRVAFNRESARRSLPANLNDLSPAILTPDAFDHVVQRALGIIGADAAGEMSMSRFDSLTLVELWVHLSEACGVELPMEFFHGDSTVSSLSESIRAYTLAQVVR